MSNFFYGQYVRYVKRESVGGNQPPAMSRGGFVVFLRNENGKTNSQITVMDEQDAIKRVYHPDDLEGLTARIRDNKPTRPVFEGLQRDKKTLMAENEALKNRLARILARLVLIEEMMGADVVEDMTHAQRNGAVILWRAMLRDLVGRRSSAGVPAGDDEPSGEIPF